MGILEKKLNWFYAMRERIWSYPMSLLGIKNKVISLYQKTRPFSHILLISVIFSLIGSITIAQAESVMSPNESELIEGVIIGQKGRPKIVNPILISDNPVESDLSAIIYEGLIHVNLDGEVEGELAQSWKQLDENGLSYRFQLKDNVYWQDGEKFTSRDVIATFTILKSLGDRNYYAAVAGKMNMEADGDYAVTVTTETVNPAIYEYLQWGIMPAHIIEGANPSTFATHPINKSPIGTGAFKLSRVEENRISLVKNSHYHKGDVRLDRFTFVLFEDAEAAFNALVNGQVHQIANPEISYIGRASSYSNIESVESTPLYPIYWALYFNLREGASPVFQEQDVRQAVTMGINKQRIITSVYHDKVIEAKGPIPENSWAFNDKIERLVYDPQGAQKILDDAGWIKTDNSIRMKDDQKLEFKLSYLDSPDKRGVVEYIQQDLMEIGISVIPDPHDAEDLRNAFVASRNFESLLYAVETSVDPDRLDFWHENAILPPGRNISSYKSDESKTIFDDQGNQLSESIVNITLQNGFSFVDRDKRNGIAVIDGEKSDLGQGYLKFQEVLLNDAPVVFLYHPKFIYLTRSRVNGISLEGMSSTSDRFLHIQDWYINL